MTVTVVTCMTACRLALTMVSELQLMASHWWWVAAPPAFWILFFWEWVASVLQQSPWKSDHSLEVYIWTNYCSPYMEYFWIANHVLAMLASFPGAQELRLCIKLLTWHHWFSLSIYTGKMDIELLALLDDDLVTFTQSALQSQRYHLSCRVND